MQFFLNVFVVGYHVLARGIWAFLMFGLAATALAAAPRLVPRLIGDAGAGMQEQAMSGLAILTMLLPWLAFFCLAAVVTHGALRILGGQHVTPMECLTGGIARLILVLRVAVPATILVVFLVSLAMGSMMILSMFALPELSLLFPLLIAAAPLSAFLGWLLAIPVVAALWVIVPVAMTDKLAGFASIARSAALTKGRRTPISAIIATLSIGIFLLFGALIWLRFYADSAVVGVAMELAGWVLVSLLWIVAAVLPAVSYGALRMEKEGVGLDELAVGLE